MTRSQKEKYHDEIDTPTTAEKGNIQLYHCKGLYRETTYFTVQFHYPMNW